ncbi:hypothetical protein [Sulfurimonas sp.]|uniref:hypothetical protein n=1 Tax=Sulfurimonas sp. TaxID=2022749 RepID=UPI002B481E68|nr:hypothetical protein [Sulfurimonas sp.]
MKKTILIMVMLFAITNLQAYSYAAAGKEPTIDAKEQITKALNEDNFKEALKIFKENEKNYKYLTKEFIPSLYNGLEISIQNKDKKKTMKYLELSLAAEIQRRIDGGLQNIKTYNVAKVMVLKAKKFYNLLAVSLDNKTNKRLESAINNCIRAIGNPGLFGVGSKPANKNDYIKNQKIIIEVIQFL